MAYVCSRIQVAAFLSSKESHILSLFEVIVLILNIWILLKVDDNVLILYFLQALSGVRKKIKAELQFMLLWIKGLCNFIMMV